MAPLHPCFAIDNTQHLKFCGGVPSVLDARGRRRTREAVGKEREGERGGEREREREGEREREREGGEIEGERERVAI